MSNEGILAQTPLGKASRENHLRTLEALLDQATWENAEKRASDLAGYREMAKNIRAADASIPDLQPRSYRGAASVTFQAEFPHMLEKIQSYLEASGIATVRMFGQRVSSIIVPIHAQDTEHKRTILLTLAASYKQSDTWEDVETTADKWGRFCVRFPGFWILIADSDKNGVLMQFDDTPEGYTQARRYCVKMSELDVLETTKTVEELEEEWEKVLDATDEEQEGW